MQTTLILLAAGSSSRMGGTDKMLEDVGGMPCVRAMALRGIAAGLPVIVTLPDRDHPRNLALAETPVQTLPVPDAGDGVAHSIRAAVSALPDSCEAAILLPADMPAIRSADLAVLVATASANPDAMIVQGGTADGTPGHPVLFRSALFPEFGDLTGDVGARSIVQKHRATRRVCRFSDDRALLDLDTPADWATWRTGQAAPPGA